MKKMIFALSIVLFFSCDLIPPDTTVINNSSYPVSFKFSRHDIDTVTLNPNDSASSRFNFSSVVILSPERRVSQSRNQFGDNIITISDLQSWDVYVENRTNTPVTLSAGGWMYDMIVIPTGDIINDAAQIGRVFTSNPNFYVVSDTFPYDVQWQFRDNIFYVVIRG